MTAPNLVWINNGDNQQTWLRGCNKQHTRCMIDRDMAEDLARALEALLESPDQLSARDAIQALARFREASR